MARAKKYIDGLVRAVRKDWKYYNGKKERSWRLVFEYLTPEGEKITIKERFDLKASAELKLSQLEKEHTNKDFTFAHRNLLFEEYAKTYKAEKLAVFDKAGKIVTLHITTGKTECSKVDVMIEFFKGRKLQSIRRVDAKRFKLHLEGLTSHHTKRPLTPRTVFTYLDRLSALLNEAKADEHIISVPEIRGLIDRNLEVRRTDKTITTAQLFDLLSKCDEPIREGGRFADRKHLKLPLIASHELGARIGEIRDIKRSHILHIDHEIKSGIVRIINKKASKLKGKLIVKDVAISEWLYDEIMANGILDLPADSIAFMRFPHYKTAWNKLREMANLGDIRWHDLRAVNATNRKVSGQDLEMIQAQGGWEKGSKIPEQNYIRMNPEHWQKAMDSLQDYNAYTKFLRERARAVIESEAVN